MDIGNSNIKQIEDYNSIFFMFNSIVVSNFQLIAYLCT